MLFVTGQSVVWEWKKNSKKSLAIITVEPAVLYGIGSGFTNPASVKAAVQSTGS